MIDNSETLPRETLTMFKQYVQTKMSHLTENQQKNIIKIVDKHKKNLNEAIDYINSHYCVKLEILEFVEKYENLDEIIEYTNEGYPFRKILKYETRHLPLFEELDKTINLLGKGYILPKKMCWYQIIGLSARGQRPYKKVTLGGIRTDTRLQTIFFMPPGQGKKNIKYALKNILTQAGYSVVEPTSFHPEALIGKMVEVRELNPNYKKSVNSKWLTKKIPNLGHFNNDFIQVDEGFKLLTDKDPNGIETRRYFRIAQDPFGENQVTKKSVDDLPSDIIKYFPPTSFQIFSQPKFLPPEVVEEGDLRRNISYMLSFYEQEEPEYSDRSEGNCDFESEIKLLAGYLTNIRNSLIKEFSFTKEAKIVFNELHKELLYQGYTHSKKGRYFTKIMAWTLQDLLAKMSAIQATSRGETTITEDYVKLAFIDLVEFWDATLNVVNRLVKGNWEAGMEWVGATAREITCLQYLLEKKADSFENSQVPIQEFQDYIKKVTNTTSDDTARYYYNSMREKGLIASKQKGQHDSRVWLTFKPTKLQGVKGSKGTVAYSLIIDSLNSILNSGRLPPLSSLLPSIVQEEEVRNED